MYSLYSAIESYCLIDESGIVFLCFVVKIHNALELFGTITTTPNVPYSCINQHTIL
jgi:hypothetical protein